MKKIIYLLTLSLCIPIVCLGNWYEITTNGQVISYGKIAKEGKVSVFILSTNWCSPCAALKKRLQDTKFDQRKIDFYYVNMSGNMKYEQLKQTNGYQIWRKVEQINSWPTVYITGQTSNIVSSFSAEEEAYPYDKIIKITNDLLIDGQLFDQTTMFKGNIREISGGYDNVQDDNGGSPQNIPVTLPNEHNSGPDKRNGNTQTSVNNPYNLPPTKYRFRLATLSTKPPTKKIKALDKLGTPVVIPNKGKWIIYLEEVDIINHDYIIKELQKLGYTGVVWEQLVE